MFSVVQNDLQSHRSCAQLGSFYIVYKKIHQRENVMENMSAAL